MININNQNKVFLEVSKKLDRKIECYVIGGTAMMFYNLKELTKDIDLVFENEEDRNVFIEALESLGYKKMDSRILYGKKKNQPEMLSFDDYRFDLFLLEIISFIFSENSKKRIDTIREFDHNLVIKVADPNDIFLMKCATERIKDLDDAKAIIDRNLIKWDVLLEETKNQINLGKQRAALDLGLFLEDLEKQDIKPPKEFSDKLFKIVENQAREKQKKTNFLR